MTNQSISRFFAFIAEHGLPLVFVPALLPIYALVRLARLSFLDKCHIPFLDGWFIHLAILLPYAILAAAAIR